MANALADPMPTADELLKALQGAGLPITGVSIKDPNDSTTWRFDGKPLSSDQFSYAVLIVNSLLFPPPPVVKTVGPSVDDVITWGAVHFGQTKQEALDEIAALTAPKPPAPIAQAAP